MRAIARAAAVRALDLRMIEEAGVPAAVLMEHAGHGCADAIRARFADVPRRVRVLCGPGNNGGDGYVLARHLAVHGWDVVVSPLAPPRTPEAQAHARVCAALGLTRAPPAGWGPALVVDAVLGTGARGGAGALLDGVTLPDDAVVVAIDVPTGMDADTGAVAADARATPAGARLLAPDHAVVIGRRKPWMYVHPVSCSFVDIGLDLVADDPPEAVEADPYAPQVWDAGADKWARGHVGVRAGSPEMAGAAVLACVGALHAGAGLVTLFIVREAWPRLGALPPEVMVAPPEDITRAAGARCDALVVGPGLGRGADDEVRALWATEARACVFDADALRAVAPLATLAPAVGPRLLTPHAGEAAALLGASRERVTGDRLAAAAALGAVAATVLKGPCSVVAGDGPARVHPGWLPQLGTAGSGDVLAGVCGALLARSPRALPRAEVVERASHAVAMHLHAARSLHVGAGAGDVARALRP